MWRPYVIDHDDYDTWSAAGGEDYAARARRFAREMFTSHVAEPLAEDVRRGLAALSGRTG
jgi:trimethylamine:corrinoid methyltransferase-like protein